MIFATQFEGDCLCVCVCDLVFFYILRGRLPGGGGGYIQKTFQIYIRRKSVLCKIAYIE